MAWVVCAQCNSRYDSKVLGFCSRCGSNLHAGEATPGPRADLRRDPGRMRVQLGGILLLLVGGLYLAGAVTSLVDPGPGERQLYLWGAAQADGEIQGGQIIVHVANGTVPVAGAHVRATIGNRSLAEGSTGADGTFNSTLNGSVATEVQVTFAGRSWMRQALVPSSQSVDIHLDIATAPATSDRVAGAVGLAITVMVATLVLSLLLALGGLAAILARWRGLALAGPLPVVVLSALLVALLPGLGTLVILAMVGVPYALVLSGRSAFRRT